MKLRVGTRRSPLALTQTKQALDLLVSRSTGLSYELVEIVTTGDRIQDRPLREAGGKGLFLKELDEALIGGRVDCAVHSLKDVPSELAAGTTLAAVLERVDARDILVTRDGRDLAALAADVEVGTTSLRRATQLLARLPKARIRLLRGNVETRLRKLVDGDCDATFLAAAGLSRLGLSLEPAQGVALDPFEFVPAPGQGALGITTRSDDEATLAALSVLEHPASRAAVLAERAFARVFGGGCHLPLAAYARLVGDEVELVGLLSTPDGATTIRDSVRGPASGAEVMGEALGRAFLGRGGAEILAAVEAGL